MGVQLTGTPTFLVVLALNNKQEVPMRIRTAAIAGVMLAAIFMALALPAHFAPKPGGDVAELKVTIHEWAIPTKGGHPHDPAVGAGDSLWFTEQMANKLGRLDLKTGEFKEYPLNDGKNAGPHGLIADKDGNIWFTANFGGYIGKLDPQTGAV